MAEKRTAHADKKIWETYGNTAAAWDKAYDITEWGSSLAIMLVCNMESLLLLALVGEGDHGVAQRLKALWSYLWAGAAVRHQRQRFEVAWKSHRNMSLLNRAGPRPMPLPKTWTLCGCNPSSLPCWEEENIVHKLQAQCLYPISHRQPALRWGDMYWPGAPLDPG